MATGATAASLGYESNFPLSYGYNSMFITNASVTVPTAGAQNAGGRNIAQVVAPAATVLFSDGMSDVRSTANRDLPPLEWTELINTTPQTGFGLDPMETISTTTTSVARGGPLARHLETTNVAFADGHVKAMKIEKWYYAAQGSDKITPWMNPLTGGTP
jgi:prepilin-type processing-associated H-X9-DG protein